MAASSTYKSVPHPPPDIYKFSLSYSLAIAQAALGYKVSRQAWIGVGKPDSPDTFVFQLGKDCISIKNIKLWKDKDEPTPAMISTLMIKGRRSNFLLTYTPSSNDINATDWYVVEPGYSIYQKPKLPEKPKKQQGFLDTLAKLFGGK